MYLFLVASELSQTILVLVGIMSEQHHFNSEFAYRVLIPRYVKKYGIRGIQYERIGKKIPYPYYMVISSSPVDFMVKAAIRKDCLPVRVRFLLAEQGEKGVWDDSSE